MVFEAGLRQYDQPGVDARGTGRTSRSAGEESAAARRAGPHPGRAHEAGCGVDGQPGARSQIRVRHDAGPGDAHDSEHVPDERQRTPAPTGGLAGRRRDARPDPRDAAARRLGAGRCGHGARLPGRIRGRVATDAGLGPRLCDDVARRAIRSRVLYGGCLPGPGHGAGRHVHPGASGGPRDAAGGAPAAGERRLRTDAPLVRGWRRSGLRGDRRDVGRRDRRLAADRVGDPRGRGLYGRVHPAGPDRVGAPGAVGRHTGAPLAGSRRRVGLPPVAAPAHAHGADLGCVSPGDRHRHGFGDHDHQ